MEQEASAQIQSQAIWPALAHESAQEKENRNSPETSQRNCQCLQRPSMLR